MSLGIDLVINLIAGVSAGAIANAIYSLVKSYKAKEKLLSLKPSSDIKISFTKQDGTVTEIELDPKNEASIRQFIKKATEEVENGN